MLVQRKKKNTIYLLIAVILLFFTFSTPVLAVTGEEFIVGEFKYMVLSEEGNTGTVVNEGFAIPLTADYNNLTIPGHVYHNGIDYTVVKIGVDAFAEMNYKITGTVIIEEGIIELDENAFLDNAIQFIHLPSTLEIIGLRALAINQIETIELPENLRIIKAFAFASNNLKKLVIPASIEEIQSVQFVQNNEFNQIFFENPNADYASSYFGYALYLDTIVEIYLPRLADVEYQKVEELVKTVDDTLELSLNYEVNYQQVERYDAALLQRIGPEENAPTYPYNLNFPVTITWYKNGELIPNANSTLYQEQLDEVGIFQYHAKVNDVILNTITVQVEQPLLPELEADTEIRYLINSDQIPDSFEEFLEDINVKCNGSCKVKEEGAVFDSIPFKQVVQDNFNYQVFIVTIVGEDQSGNYSESVKVDVHIYRETKYSLEASGFEISIGELIDYQENNTLNTEIIKHSNAQAMKDDPYNGISKLPVFVKDASSLRVNTSRKVNEE